MTTTVERFIKKDFRLLYKVIKRYDLIESLCFLTCVNACILLIPGIAVIYAISLLTFIIFYTIRVADYSRTHSELEAFLETCTWSDYLDLSTSIRKDHAFYAMIKTAESDVMKRTLTSI